MATRFYFTSDTTAPTYAPAYGLTSAWNHTEYAVRRKMSTAKDATSMVSKTIYDGSSPGAFDPALAVQWQSPLITPGTMFLTGDTIKAQCRVMQSGADDHILVFVHKIYIANGTSLKVTLRDGTAGDFGEWVVGTLTNRNMLNSVSFSGLASHYMTVRGDYLVYEMGGTTDASAGTTTTGSFSLGSDNGTDLPEDSSTTTANNPWFETSTNITFLDALPDYSTHPHHFVAEQNTAVNAARR